MDLAFNKTATNRSNSAAYVVIQGVKASLLKAELLLSEQTHIHK